MLYTCALLTISCWANVHSIRTWLLCSLCLTRQMGACSSPVYTFHSASHHITSYTPKVGLNFFSFFLFYTLYWSLVLVGNLGCLTRVRLQQPQEQRYPVLQVHAGSFRVSVIRQSLTRTTGSLTCVRDRSCVCVYTRGLATQTASQHTFFDSEKPIKFFFCSWQDLNSWSWNMKSDALPIVPPQFTGYWFGGFEPSLDFEAQSSINLINSIYICLSDHDFPHEIR